MLTVLITDDSGRTGVHFDEKGRRMNGSAQVRDPEFSERVVAKARAFLALVLPGLKPSAGHQPSPGPRAGSVDVAADGADGADRQRQLRSR